ncbi:TetR family transcriptional regulator [Kutzneria buriramensis]|uniref:AcrR family transcriptional regulator n=1 Tax=Kutzneria buriramensis TaxID=1045776 RepID=A0A3E0I0J8_9PSEU|nr:TetR family transcriptional regulator [Kutzneria buriramensis]REH52254.1 AcrR family transcriptional regulator [Kutzneria buriramensis]
MTEGLRARARLAMRTEIAETAFALFVERGFEQTTVDEIAEAAGLSRRSFFRYFPSKEDAVFGLLYDLGEELAAAVAARPAAEPPWDALRASCAVLIEPMLGRAEDAMALLRLIHETPSLRARHQDKQDRWRKLLTDALQARSVPRLDADVLASAALAVFDVVCREWLFAGAPGDIATLMDEAFAVLAPTRG